MLNTLKVSKGSEIFIPKMPSIHILDLIKIINEDIGVKITGIRPGEKIHESLCSIDEATNLYENKESFLIYSQGDVTKKKIGKKVKNSFSYTSNSKLTLNINKIKNIIKKI